MKTLGLRIGHDAAAAIVVDGKIVADAAEERFSRVKHDGSFPLSSINYCLREAGIESGDLDCLALANEQFPDHSRCYFTNLIDLEATRFCAGVPIDIKLKEVLPERMGGVLPLYLKPLALSPKCKIFLSGHHAAHAASAYYTSGLEREERALIATVDGGGDGISVGIWRGEGGKVSKLELMSNRSSLGWFYSNVTEALGWRHGGDEWKVMGLAPYGVPQPGIFKGFYPEFEDGKLISPHDFGVFGRWSDHGSNHYHGQEVSTLAQIVDRIGRENSAAEAQRVIEVEMQKLIIPWLKRENTKNLLCAGGLFLNVKFNQLLWYSGKVGKHWVYPNPGDAGLGAGAALLANAFYEPETEIYELENLYLGPTYTPDEIRTTLKERGLTYREVENPSAEAAEQLIQNKVVGWFQGRMESGPRALGNRSILMSPTRAENKDIINSKVKFRESFRPFCPSILYEKAEDYLIKSREEPFMLTSFLVKEEWKGKMPAVVHVDGSARPQMVRRSVNPRYYELIERFGDKSGVYAVLNTSYNVKGEPIVCSPRDAIRTFYDTGLDVLILDRFVVEKKS